ncbi:MAG: hypothetical protein H6576_04975 [Lewinellaceae bacterium]|nr:hypothetical protein [Saprospiraceae bacterium]MCB9343023.1 hypothetical protein [Lewinellaceae bacterium]
MKTILLQLLLMAPMALWSQTYMTVTYTKGKVHYYAPQQKNPTSIYPGLSLSSEGKIQCEPDSKVKLLCKGKIYEYTDSKLHSLDEIARQANNSSSLSFIGRFWNFLTGSMDGTEDATHLQQHHEKSMESLRAGIKGYGSKEFEIQANLMYEGKLSNEEVTFMWSPDMDTPFCFQLSRQADDEVIMVAWTKENYLSLKLADLTLSSGEAYEWQIITSKTDPKAPHSRKMQFVYDPEAAAKALSQLKAQSAYESASKTEQTLMELYTFETNSFYYDAYLGYQQLIGENPDDVLVKRAYAAFLARIDKMDEAQSMIK